RIPDKSRTLGQFAGILITCPPEAIHETRCSFDTLELPVCLPAGLAQGDDVRLCSSGFSVPPMNEITRILSAAEQGDSHAVEQLLPLVYEELRRLAAQKLAQEKPGQTLQATALVHDAYVRLVGTEKAQNWSSRNHFFAAAAEAMRRILVENYRRKKSVKHGGDRDRVPLEEIDITVDTPSSDLLALDEALSRLA